MIGTPEHTYCARTQTMRALFWVLAPATVAATPFDTFGLFSTTPWLVSFMLAAVMVVAGVRLRPGRIWLRTSATIAYVLWSAGALYEHTTNPSRGLAVLLGLISFLAIVWPSEQLRRADARKPHRWPHINILLTSAIAALFGLDEWYTFEGTTSIEPLALALAYAVPVVLAARSSAFQSRLARPVLWVAACATCLPVLGVLLRAFGTSIHLTPYGLLSPLLMFAMVGFWKLLHRDKASTPPEAGLFDLVLLHPARILVVSFFAICACGTLLLGLPVASSHKQALSWLDAAFTAVSATCVTGLIVVDTPVVFSSFGQVVLLGLIQLGGLGIMVFSASAILLMGQRMSLSHERVAVELVGAPGRAGLREAIRTVFLVTFVTEAAAAILLFFGFLLRGEGVGVALWKGVFTSISAFCNAGFALQSDSLVPYAKSPYILSVISITIIVGGLGPLVVTALVRWRDVRLRTLHVKLVLCATALLLLVPMLLIVIIEWKNTLAGMSTVDKLFNAGFQSVTMRTAGFNSIDLALVHPATWTIMILLMFVGGSPGSTAGGIKTTTIAVLVLAIFAVIRGRQQVELFGRTISTALVMRATAITSMGVLGCFAALFALLLTQTIPLQSITFEVISALATVGVSTGATAALDEVGKLIIMACMFTGRVGMLTLFVFLASNEREPSNRQFPHETVPIG